MQREQFAVKRLCALYAVTRAGYYAWRQRDPSARQRQDAALLEQIQAIFTRSRGTYGSPRIHRALAALGVRVSRRRVGRLLRQAGLRARALKLCRRIPGLHGFFTSIPNRQLDCLATGPDQVWVALARRNSGTNTGRGGARVAVQRLGHGGSRACVLSGPARRSDRRRRAGRRVLHPAAVVPPLLVLHGLIFGSWCGRDPSEGPEGDWPVGHANHLSFSANAPPRRRPQ
jgi:helix-turn-helix protein